MLKQFSGKESETNLAEVTAFKAEGSGPQQITIDLAVSRYVV